MNRLRILKGALAASAAFAFAAAAYAAVTFDPATGTGFVGKGDVQLALGLNNAQLQAQAGSLVFTYATTTTYKVTEVWATGNPNQPKSLNSHEVEVTTIAGVNGSIAYDPRRQNQVTGFNLNGFSSLTVTGTVPVPDEVYYVTYTWTDNKGVVHTTDEMPVDGEGNLYTEGNRKAVASVEVISSTSVLYVNGVELPITPIL